MGVSVVGNDVGGKPPEKVPNAAARVPETLMRSTSAGPLNRTYVRRLSSSVSPTPSYPRSFDPVP